MPDKRSVKKLPRIQRDILSFFVENQGSIDTPRGISTWINQNIRDVRRALEVLAKKGFLKAHRTPSTIAYSCSLTSKQLADLSTAKE